MSNFNQDEQYERKRLLEVFSEIDKQKEQILAKTDYLEDDVVDLRKEFWDDVTVNIENEDELIETHASIRQQAELLSERERTHGQLHDQLKKLEQLEDSPYFGRIDFKETGEGTDQIYIGRASLMDEDDLEFLVYDWRAPISSMYYDFTPGPAQFNTMDGKINGEILLKRQFIIKRGKLEGMFDTGLTIGDHLLQQALGKQASTKMASIVATIQQEQNKVIRHEKTKYLIVQGVAGSGKTSAALQRIAYLLYRHRDLLNEKNMVLFSPNNLFSSYVANVLPELGEENIQQTTYLRFIDKNIKDLTIESPFDQMEYVLIDNKDDAYNLRIENIQLKSSIAYKKIIDEYLQELQGEGIVFTNIMFRHELLITEEQIANYFYSIDRDLPLKNKINLLSSWLRERVEQLREQEPMKDWVMEQIELLDDAELTEVYYQLQEEEEMDGFYDSGKEEVYLRQKIVDEAVEPLNKYIDDFKYIDLLKTYEQMLTVWRPKEVPVNWTALCQLTIEYFRQGKLFWEEATPFSYFSDEITGDSANRSIRHLVIDEAQDYTPFQIAYLKHIFPYTHFTLLGDINQAIYAQTQEGNQLEKFTGENTERIELTKSYRSTKEIVQFTKEFAPTGQMIQPFERSGNKPTLYQVNEQNHYQIIEGVVAKLQEEGHETIGIVCQSMQEVNLLQENLADELHVKQMDERSKEFSKGVLILPIYLAKGIEFDAVIIPDGSSTRYRKTDRTLFYTACTRAMHELVIMSASSWCSFIQDANPGTYQLIDE